ncbi:alpha/beta hydrolase [Altererythrobacter sp. KTW20L]|uniref:alpha/beta hydrolase n=1 Tax=Altererythrobacter sp. KTW20L TaxID=2942210 RepID=UPI0020C168D0|nr:alpha/beta hydrolase [Altererythrobacter sp. KTW20L]MCL6249630.1 alpha/beta hydrolase [Altererythrobacter sp. KTW20L]
MRRLAFALLAASASLALVTQPVATAAQSRRADSTVQTLAYGSDEEQVLDYWPGARADAPLVVFVHGGGWKRGDKNMMRGSDKLRHWQSQGYAVASINYRLVPDHTVEQQAADVASAVAYLKAEASHLRFDANRIALVGHSAGAHLVAVAGTDPQHFRVAGLSMDDVVGIVPLDGAGFNVPDQMGENPRLMGATYRQAFGTDPARQRALSPTFHAAAPNAPAFLILHVQRDDARRQSNELAERLRVAGTPASVQEFRGRGLRGHAQINRDLGDPDYPATPVVDAFLARVFAR